MDDKTMIAIIKAVSMILSTGFGLYCMWKMKEMIDPRSEHKKASKENMERLKKTLKMNDIDLNRHEMRLAGQVVLPDDGVSIEEVGGMQELITQLKEQIIIPLNAKAANLHIPSKYYASPKGVLLHGPPGCGKTLLARAIAKEAKARFINFDLSLLEDCWYGETCKLTRALFTLSKKLQPCIIFIDEIDSVLRSRMRSDHEATANMKTQFMLLWDGFADSDAAITIIGATNRPTDIDDAVMRRLPVRIHVPMPDVCAREEILRVLLRNENRIADFNYYDVANATENFSGSDLKEVVRSACLSKYRSVLGGDNLPSSDEFQARIDEVKIAPEDIIRAAGAFMKNNEALKRPFMMDLTADLD